MMNLTCKLQGKLVAIKPYGTKGSITELSFSFFQKKIEIEKMKELKARFKRRTLHVPNLMQMSENNRFFPFALDSAHLKFDV